MLVWNMNPELQEIHDKFANIQLKINAISDRLQIYLLFILHIRKEFHAILAEYEKELSTI